MAGRQLNLDALPLLQWHTAAQAEINFIALIGADRDKAIWIDAGDLALQPHGPADVAQLAAYFLDFGGLKGPGLYRLAVGNPGARRQLRKSGVGHEDSVS